MSKTPPKNTRKKPSLSMEAVREAQDKGPIGRYLGSQIRLTHIAALDALEGLFAPHKSSPIRFALMGQVDALPGSTQGSLAEILDVDRTTLVPMVASMERQGLIRRRVSDNDKRATQIWLTAKGEALLAKLKPIAAAHERRLRGTLTDTEIDAFLDTLRLIRRNVRGR